MAAPSVLVCYLPAYRIRGPMALVFGCLSNLRGLRYNPNEKEEHSINPDTNNPAAFAVPGLLQTASEGDTNGRGLDNQGQAVDTEELVYDCVPPKQTITVSVRYRIRGRGQPLPYALDEEDGQ